MTTPLVVIGAGGFGRETLDIVDALATTTDGQQLLGVVDDAPSDLNLARLRTRGVPYLGSLADWLAPSHDGERYVLAIGRPQTRRRLAELIDSYRRDASILVHPGSSIGSQSVLAPGTIVCAGAIVSTNVRCGIHAHVNPGAIIGHDASIGSFASINPGSVISGSTEIRNEVLIGAGATVLQGLTIGERAIVGAGACVIRDVAPDATVKGIPAR